MAFQDYFAAISSPALGVIAAHWDQARGERAMPAWEALRPSAIAGQLNMLWVFRYDADSEEFTGRLAGDRIARGFERNFRGVPLKDLHPPQYYPRIYEGMRNLARRPAMVHLKGKLFRQRDRVGMGERIVLPLSTDGIHCDGMLGASEYSFGVYDFSYGPVEILTGAEKYYPLGPPRAVA